MRLEAKKAMKMKEEMLVSEESKRRVTSIRVKKVFRKSRLETLMEGHNLTLERDRCKRLYSLLILTYKIKK